MRRGLGYFSCIYRLLDIILQLKSDPILMKFDKALVSFWQPTMTILLQLIHFLGSMIASYITTVSNSLVIIQEVAM